VIRRYLLERYLESSISPVGKGLVDDQNSDGLRCRVRRCQLKRLRGDRQRQGEGSTASHRAGTGSRTSAQVTTEL
jgi:hypothetical protein